MSRADNVEVEGKVTKSLRGGKFEVEITRTGTLATCSPSGKLRTNFIRILPGDSVTVELSPYDLTKGIITWRKK